MIERAISVGVPFVWVAADSIYSVGEIETALLRRAGKGHVLGVNANRPFRSWAKPQAIAGTAKDIAESLLETAWRCLSAGDGTKGERLHDWAYLKLADLDAGDYNNAFAGLWTDTGAADPLVRPGNPPHRHTALPATNPPTSSHGHSGDERIRQKRDEHTSNQMRNYNDRNLAKSVNCRSVKGS